MEAGGKDDGAKEEEEDEEDADKVELNFLK